MNTSKVVTGRIRKDAQNLSSDPVMIKPYVESRGRPDINLVRRDMVWRTTKDISP